MINQQLLVLLWVYFLCNIISSLFCFCVLIIYFVTLILPGLPTNISSSICTGFYHLPTSYSMALCYSIYLLNQSIVSALSTTISSSVGVFSLQYDLLFLCTNYQFCNFDLARTVNKYQFFDRHIFLLSSYKVF